MREKYNDNLKEALVVVHHRERGLVWNGNADTDLTQAFRDIDGGGGNGFELAVFYCTHSPDQRMHCQNAQA